MLWNCRPRALDLPPYALSLYAICLLTDNLCVVVSCSDSPPRRTSSSPVTTTAASSDNKTSTGVSMELFPEFGYTRRDRDGAATDRRPPLPPPRRPAPAPRPALDKFSPPPPPATTATASIEDVIGRLRLDEEARKTGAGAGDCVSVRRVPRMGTRLCSDVTPPRSTGVNDPAETTTTRPADITLEDRLGSVSSAALDGGSSGSVDRKPGVSRCTQTDNHGSPAVEGYPRVCADVMYTNRANLRHTIAVQQRLFLQQLADRQGITTLPRSTDDRPPADSHAGRPPKSTTGKLEWIVRKRSDGSR